MIIYDERYFGLHKGKEMKIKTCYLLVFTLSTKTEECISRFEQNLEFKKTDSPIFVQIGFFNHFHELKFGQFSVSKIIHHDA